MSTPSDHESVEVLESEKNILLDHNYDGIHEFDHPLPTWWKGTFIITIIFSIPYFAYYVMMNGPSLDDELNISLKKYEAIRAEAKLREAFFDQKIYDKILANPNVVTEGLEVYQENCQACHSDKGKGDVGPNLTDAYWLQADGTPKTLYETAYRKVMPKKVNSLAGMSSRITCLPLK